MSQLKQVNIGNSLIALHRIITRGINVTAENSQLFAHNGIPDTYTGAGFICYVQSLISVLSSHHKTEDDLAFPYMRNLIPDAPYDGLAAEHRQIAAIVAGMDVVLQKVESDEQLPMALNDLHSTIISIQRIWHPHIQKEEDNFSVRKLAELIDPEEHKRLNHLFTEHSRELTSPDYLIVPFMLYNISGDDRAIISEEMPPVVTQDLVPGVWKDKWEPMRSFLLSP